MNRRTKRLVLMTFDLFVIFLAHVTSYFFFSELVAITPRAFIIHLIFVMLIYIVFGSFVKIFDKINRFTSIRETIIHALLVTITYITATILYEILGSGKSYRLVALSYLVAVILIPLRGWRILMEHRLKREQIHKYVGVKEPIRTLIIGAGSAGAIFIRSIRLRSDIRVVGILDDDRDKQNTTVYGYPVVGTISDLQKIVERYNVEQITIAIPSLSNEEMKEIVTEARKTNVKTNQMPYIEDVLSGDYQLDEFKEIEVTDILGRDEVELDTQVIGKQVVGKTVLVSGAGGSIGSEIVRQVAKFSPAKIILLGHGEFSIYQIEKEIKQFKDRTFEIIPVIADIQDRERIFEVMKTHQPDIVYHAAAHKHVPLMEANPREAVKNNIFGTKNLAEAAKAAKVSAFVMGATKRIAEMIVTGLNEKGKTNFVAVRFGNVLNSSGSVVPVFKEQIEKGGPITVTDFRMTRYFMTIPEASRLVMQAGALAKGGEIFVLDMGEPVKIAELARQMIWLSGHTEDEIEIVKTGIRPGEKLYEELLADDENTEEQIFEKIFVGKVHNLPIHQVNAFINSLEALSTDELKEALVQFANNTYEENQEIIEELETQGELA